ncbi:hypothetical protein ACFLT9_06885 [Acidobacteriota bacterium]
MEMWRRIILVFSFLLAVVFYKWASLQPVLVVEAVDFAKEQTKLGRWTERDQYLAQLPFGEFVNEVTKDKTLAVYGVEWESFFAGVIAASLGKPGAGKEWLRRIPEDQRDRDFSARSLFFHRGDPPLDQVFQSFVHGMDDMYLALSRGDQMDYLHITYHVFNHEDFQYGSGFSGNKPPIFMFNPLRPFSLWILLAGLLFYIFWPVPKREEGAIFYPRWRLIFGDFVALLFTGAFFTLPILVVGGTLQAFTLGLPLMSFFLIMSGLGIWMLWVLCTYAGFSVMVRPDRLDFTTLDGGETIPFRNIEFFQPLVAKPPRWLVILMWLGAFASRGSGQVGQFGRAMILSGTSYSGLNLKLKDGTSRYLWISDQMGGQALKAAEKIPEALEGAGISMEEEPKVIKAIGMKSGEGRKKGAREKKIKRIFVLIWVVSLIFLAAAAWSEYLDIPGSSDRVFVQREFPRDNTTPAEREMGKIPPAEVTWEHVFGSDQGGGSSVGRALLRTADGEYLAAGHSSDFKTDEGSDLDFYVIRTDEKGAKLWEKTYGSDLPDYLKSVCPTRDGGFLLVGERERSQARLLDESSDIYLVRIDSAGELIWKNAFGGEKTFERVFAARERADGGFELPVVTDGAFSILRLNQAGEKVSETELAMVGPEAEREILWAAPTRDGGYILTGEVLNEGGGFKDLMLVKLDASGQEEWDLSSGGSKKESGTFVLEMQDGGFTAVGIAESEGEYRGRLYLVRTNSTGDLLWAKSFGPANMGSTASVQETADGGLAAVGSFKAEGRREGIYIVRTDAGGILKWEGVYSLEGSGYMPEAISGSEGDGFLVCGTLALGDFEIKLFLLKIKGF